MAKIKWVGWFKLETLQILARHLGCLLVTMASFWIAGSVLKLLFDGWIKDYIIFAEHCIFLVLYGWFAYQTGLELWKDRIKFGDALEIVFA